MAAAQEVDGQAGYFHYRLAQEQSPHPNTDTLGRAYDYLVSQLNANRFPSPYSSEITGISPDVLRPYDLLGFYGLGGGVLTPGTPDASAATAHKKLALGYQAFESPPEYSFLRPDLPTALVRFDPKQDPEFFKAYLETVSAMAGIKAEEQLQYIYEVPPATAWMSYLAYRALREADTASGGKLIDPQTGKLREEFVPIAAVITGDSGGAVASVSHLYDHGIIYRHSIVHALSNVQTAIVAQLIGATDNPLTVAGACAGSGSAIHESRLRAATRALEQHIFIVITAYDGPATGTEFGFDHAGILRKTELPFLSRRKPGYVEAQGAAVKLFFSYEFAQYLGLPLDQSYRVMTFLEQGNAIFGPTPQGVPETTMEKALAYLKQQFGEESESLLLHATHGTPTGGELIEEEALANLLRGYPSYAVATISTHPEEGHAYPIRVLNSLHVIEQSTISGILPGLAPAGIDFSQVGNHYEEIQRLRQAALAYAGVETTTGIPAITDPRTGKILKFLDMLRGKRTDVNLTTQRLKGLHPGFIVHTGLGGIGACVTMEPVIIR